MCAKLRSVTQSVYEEHQKLFCCSRNFYQCFYIKKTLSLLIKRRPTNFCFTISCTPVLLVFHSYIYIYTPFAHSYVIKRLSRQVLFSDLLGETVLLTCKQEYCRWRSSKVAAKRSFVFLPHLRPPKRVGTLLSIARFFLLLLYTISPICTHSNKIDW